MTVYRSAVLDHARTDAGRPVAAATTGTSQLSKLGVQRLEAEDAELAQLLEGELRRQLDTLSMVAASSIADPSVLACAGSVLTNLTTEGYPGRRFHAGCGVADEIERLACARARAAFGARYANVQPHSGSSANLAMITALLRPGETLLGMELASGGHLTHGAPASLSSRYARVVSYGVDENGLLDYEEIRRIARAERPRLIICGASSYPRVIDFARFRAIADEVGAYLLADISHIAGLVAAGLHPSPIDHAHVTTTSTYKQLCGPRGGLILLGRDADRVVDEQGRTMADLAQRAVFPFAQGTPDLAAVAAKARALQIVTTDGFRQLCTRIVQLARCLGEILAARGYRLVTGGTDGHLLLIDLRDKGITGAEAEQVLERCGIVVNRNRVPGDSTPPRVGAGLRLGTNAVAVRGMPPAAMENVGAAIDLALRSVTGGRGRDGAAIAEDVRQRVREAVRELCRRFPLPEYP